MERGKLKLSLDITMDTMEREKLKLSLDITMDIMATMEREKLKLSLDITMDTMEREKLSLDITMDIMATMERGRQNQDITIMDIMVMESNFSPKIFSKLKSIRWNVFKRNTHLISQMKQNYTNKKVKLT